MNYIKFRRFFKTQYYYVDCQEYLADSLFYKRRIPIRFNGEYRNPTMKYIIVRCKIKKRYEKEFEAALNELYNKMIIFGMNDYESFCKDVMNKIIKGE